MPDEWELWFKLNPQDSSDGSIDSDGDGYTNIEEFINGTNRESSWIIVILQTIVRFVRRSWRNEEGVTIRKAGRVIYHN